MFQYKRLSIVLVTVFLIYGCSFYKIQKRIITVPGNADIEIKLKIAEEVAIQVWESGLLHRSVKEKYPDLSPAQYEGLFVKWHKFTYKPIIGKNKETQISVQIVVGIRYKGKINDAEGIVLLCKDIMETKLFKKIKASGDLPDR